MAHGKPPKGNQPASRPANVPGIVHELHRLAAVSRAERAITPTSLPPHQQQQAAVTRPKVTDAGFASIASMTGLRWLDLDKTRVTDAGLVHLSGLNLLERLDIHETQITEAGVAQARRALPGCRIYYGGTAVPF